MIYLTKVLIILIYIPPIFNDVQVIDADKPYVLTRASEAQITTKKDKEGKSIYKVKDGILSVQLDVKNPDKSDKTSEKTTSTVGASKNHKTGDEVPIGLIMIIGLASLVGAVWSLVLKKNLKPTKK